MAEETDNGNQRTSGPRVLAVLNMVVWAISIVALVVVMEHSPGARGLFPILAGGIAVAAGLLAALQKSR